MNSNVVDDYVLLLGALLVSADVAFIEAQFHLFDGAWRRHLFILAVVHAVAAYAYGSRMLLSLSIVAFAGWIGFDTKLPFDQLYRPALITAALLVIWREVDRRWRGDAFSRTFEHFAANIALAGALTVLVNDEVPGSLLLMALAAVTIVWGFRTGGEAFVLYGFIYGVIGLDALLIEMLGEGPKTALLVIALSMIGTIAALITVHGRFREVRS
jgi:hypothetical protein